MSNQRFEPIKDDEIRDIAVVWNEMDGRMEIKSYVRQKNFWEQHELFAATVKLMMTLLTTFGLCYGLWSHAWPMVIGAILLRILWVVVYVPRMGGAKTEIETGRV
jgi:hypothetical protein